MYDAKVLRQAGQYSEAARPMVLKRSPFAPIQNPCPSHRAFQQQPPDLRSRGPLDGPLE